MSASDFDQLRDEVDRVENACDAESSALQAQVDSLTARARDLETALATAQADDQSDEDKIAALTAQIATLSAQLVEAQAKAAEFEIEPWPEFADESVGPCINGKQDVEQKRARAIIRMPVLEESRTIQRDCEMPPPPPPPPPADDNTLVLNKREVNPAMALIPELFGLGRYTRYQFAVELSRPTAAEPDANLVWFTVNDFAAGGVIKAFLATEYEVHVATWDRVAKAWSPFQLHKTLAVKAGDKRAGMRIDVDAFPRGYIALKFKGAATEDGYEFPVYNNPDGTPIPEPEPYEPVFTGSYEVGHIGSKHVWAMQPARYTPKPRPMPPRTATQVLWNPTTVAPSTSYPQGLLRLPYKNITKQNFLPIREEVRRHNVRLNGWANTCDYQAYHWDRLIKRIPLKPPSVKPKDPTKVFGLQLLDGPRGVGTVSMLTHLMPRRGGGCWFMDPWRVGEVKADGTVQTLAGVRQRLPLKNFQDCCIDDFDIVGNYAFDGPYDMGEGWGADFIPETLPLDMSAPPINGEQPHVQNPVELVCRAQYGDILWMEGNGHDRSTPLYITKLIEGLSDPWALCCPPGGVCYVTERGKHRIIGIDVRRDSPTFGQIVRVLADGGATAAGLVASGVAKFNTTDRTAYVNDLAMARSCVSLFPEGLDYLVVGGKLKLYYSSKAQQDNREVDVESGVVTKLFDLPAASRYSTCIVAKDDLFLPESTIFNTSWSNLQSGMPLTYTRGGARIDWYNIAGTAVSWGCGGPWEGIGYASAFNTKFGWAMASSSMEGIARFSAAQPGDPIVTTAQLQQYVRGRNKWEHEGRQIIWGPDGQSFAGLPLPNDLDDDEKFYLRWQNEVEVA